MNNTFDNGYEYIVSSDLQDISNEQLVDYKIITCPNCGWTWNSQEIDTTSFNNFMVSLIGIRSRLEMNHFTGNLFCRKCHNPVIGHK